jgi:hypothetical protein
MHFCLSESPAVIHLLSVSAHLEMHWPLAALLDVQADSQDANFERHFSWSVAGVVKHLVPESAHLERHWLLPLVLPPVLLPVLLPRLPLGVQADSQDFKPEVHVFGLAPVARHLLSDSVHLEMHWLLLPMLLLAKVGKARAKLRTLAMYVNFMLSVMA